VPGPEHDVALLPLPSVRPPRSIATAASPQTPTALLIFRGLIPRFGSLPRFSWASENRVKSFAFSRSMLLTGFRSTQIVSLCQVRL